MTIIHVYVIYRTGSDDISVRCGSESEDSLNLSIEIDPEITSQLTVTPRTFKVS